MAGFPVANTVINGAGFPVSTGAPAGPWTASGTFDNASFGNPQSVPLPSSYSTKSNDLIVVAYALSGSSIPTFSGCGATWQVIDSGQTGPVSGIAVGHGCTASGTAISVGNVSASAGSLCIAVNSGNFGAANPVQESTENLITGTSITSPAFSWTGAATHTVLVVSGAGTGLASAWSVGTPPTWSDSGIVTNIAIDNNQRQSRLDYRKATANATSVTETYTVGSSATLGMAIAALVTTVNP